MTERDGYMHWFFGMLDEEHKRAGVLELAFGPYPVSDNHPQRTSGAFAVRFLVTAEQAIEEIVQSGSPLGFSTPVFGYRADVRFVDEKKDEPLNIPLAPLRPEPGKYWHWFWHIHTSDQESPIVLGSVLTTENVPIQLGHLHQFCRQHQMVLMRLLASRDNYGQKPVRFDLPSFRLVDRAKMVELKECATADLPQSRS